MAARLAGEGDAAGRGEPRAGRGAARLAGASRALAGEGGKAGGDELRAREMLIIGRRRHPSRRGFNFWALPDASGG